MVRPGRTLAASFAAVLLALGLAHAAGGGARVIEDAARSLASSQESDGSFGATALPSELGVTALCVRALCEAPLDSGSPAAAARDKAVARGLKWIRTQQRHDGSFDRGSRSGLATYRTATSVVALVAADARRPRAGRSYGVPIARARRWLEAAQREDGGWGYDKAAAASNALCTAAVLEALRGDERIAPVESRAVAFLTRTQNEDGGFPRAGDRSEVPFTAAGLHALSLCGVKKDDARVARALAWLTEHSPLEDAGREGFYFSLFHLGHAFREQRQAEDGSFRNTSSVFAEHVPAVATGLALGACAALDAR